MRCLWLPRPSARPDLRLRDQAKQSLQPVQLQPASARGARLSPNFFLGLIAVGSSPRRCQSKQQYAAARFWANSSESLCYRQAAGRPSAPRMPDLQRIPESSIFSLVAKRLALKHKRSAAAGPRPPAAQGSKGSTGGTLARLQYTIAASASTARSEHDHPRRATSEAQQETAR